MNKQHKKKFERFLWACEQPVSRVIVADIGVLGDTLGEVDTNILHAIRKGKTIYVRGHRTTYIITGHENDGYGTQKLY